MIVHAKRFLTLGPLFLPNHHNLIGNAVRKKRFTPPREPPPVPDEAFRSRQESAPEEWNMDMIADKQCGKRSRLLGSA